MPKSMTGYGSGLSTTNGRVIRVECRSVNHRYLDVSVRLPSALSTFEPLVRARSQQVLDRGRVEIKVTDETGGSHNSRIVFDQSLAESYLSALRKLEALTGQPCSDLTTLLASREGVFSKEDSEEEDLELEKQIVEALDAGLLELNRSREEEGAHLSADLLVKCSELRTSVCEIAKRAPEVPLHYREKLLLRAEELFEENRPEWYNDQRLFAETALFADRASVDEEIIRLEAHLEALEQGLRSDAAVGRQLDFLIQEILREVNTIGSKANDLSITQAVVTMKTLLEKIREQVQNLE